MLISVFLFLTVNASQEPIYMYDQISVYKSHLFSWRWFIPKLIPWVLLTFLGIYIQAMVRWSSIGRQSPIILLTTVLVVYIFLVEFYQFYHVVSFYGNFFWTYDYDEFIWVLELDDRRTRICNNYVTICLIAKFWHIVFMLVFWIFFILRSSEVQRIRYPLSAANAQNFMILYMFSWVYMYPWLKFLGRKNLDMPYYWFNLSFRRSALRVFIEDLYLHVCANIETFLNFIQPSGYTCTAIYYWYLSNSLGSVAGFRRSGLQESVLLTVLS
jgi:hypothetical protein